MSKSFVKIQKKKFGYYLFSVTGNMLYIHNIEIYPDFQHKGLFKILMEDIKNCCKINNCNSIMLQPCKQNEHCYFNTTEKLKVLYSRYGFMECENKEYMKVEI